MRRGLAGLLLLAFAASASAQSRDVRVEAAPPAVRGTAEIFVQLGHRDAVYGIAISADGRLLASASDDHTVKLWDVATTREIRTLVGHTAPVRAVALAPDGLTLASAANDKTVKVWEVATGRELHTLAHSAEVRSVAFAPDGRTLASASQDDTVRLWDVATGRERRVLQGQSVAFAPDGRTVVSGARTGAVRLWDLATGREVRALVGHARPVMEIAFAPDGRVVASADDGTVKLWEVATGRELRSVASSCCVQVSLAFAPDGGTLGVAGSSGEFTLWDATTGREIRTIWGSRNSTVSSIRFAPDGRGVFTGSGDTTIKLWDPASGRELSAFTGRSHYVNAVAFAPDGRMLAAGSADHTVKVWDVAAGRQLRVLTGHSGWVSSVAFAPDGRSLASGSGDKTIRLWETATGRELRTLVDPSLVMSIAFARDGRTLASASFDQTVKVWEIATGRQALSLPAPSSVLARPAVAVSGDGRTLAWGDSDGNVILWDITTGRELRKLAGGSGRAMWVAFTPNGRTLATAGDGVTLWDVATGRELRTLAAGEGPVAFAPDGRTLASARARHGITLWDVGSGRELRTLTGHPFYVQSIAFAPDGRTLASGGLDSTTRLWDVATGRERVTLISFVDGQSVAITPEGYYAASSDQAEESLNVRIGSQVVGIGAFRERFYRPDLVKLALAGHSLGQFARLDQVKAAPRVELHDVPATTTRPEIGVRVRLLDTGGGIGNVRLFLNGSAVAQQQARDIVPTQALESERTYTVRLVHGRNEVRVVAFNADNSAQSSPASAAITATLTARRPALHALVVGVQEFKNPKFKLKYSVADAREFADVLRQHAAPLFQRVTVTLLTTPAETTRQSVVQALRKVREAIGPEDLFVFFVASHGTVDDDEYFLITSNVGSVSTERLRADALSQGDLKDLIANIPATKKLVVIDTCNAAALGNTLQMALLTRGLTEETAMKILSRAVGSTVLSASTSTQQALEGYRGHGLLTYAIAEGLRGKADRNGDGFVSTLELAAYVDEQVPMLAERVFKRAQYPMVSPSGQGFPLSKVR